MSLFSRMFKVTQAEAHAVVDKIEDPIKMTEQGIRDLKKDLQQAMTSLAEVKGMAIRTRRDAENRKKLATDYERKAMLLLQKMQSGEVDAGEAERLATEALKQKMPHCYRSTTVSRVTLPSQPGTGSPERSFSMNTSWRCPRTSRTASICWERGYTTRTRWSASHPLAKTRSCGGMRPSLIRSR